MHSLGVDRHDVGMMQPGGRLGFGQEALRGDPPVAGAVGQDFQGHLAPEGNLPGAIHDPHSAPADLA